MAFPCCQSLSIYLTRPPAGGELISVEAVESSVKLGLFRPLAPMCGMKVNSSLGGSFDPAADNAAAGKR